METARQNPRGTAIAKIVAALEIIVTVKAINNGGESQEVCCAVVSQGVISWRYELI
jgi:hypothetical protein